jgi:hypothetical protein
MNIIEVRNLYKSYPQPGNKKESFRPSSISRVVVLPAPLGPRIP